MVNTVVAPLILNIRWLCRDGWMSFSRYNAVEHLHEQYIQGSEITDLDPHQTAWEGVSVVYYIEGTLVARRDG